ncbi:siderophore-interacting protein [Ignatzschineria larvae DSM 13226]|uniref:Siderophore-interacting protein n=1 Tax=Ignatzschineria larvae DSM 13226 TaxID=1111732 RepID=A0ABZ3C0G1_9GAMM|nr:siderophore-interacting protein [Ignatzschineria larvae]
MKVHRTTVSLVDKHYITPGYLRLTFHCEEIAPFAEVPLGVNNKLFIPPQGMRQVVMPSYNADLKVWEIEDESLRPTVRTYTHRGIDLGKKHLTVDFAIHEGDSVACQWALNAKAGDTVGLAMKLAHREVLPPRDHYLFITDMTGIPAVSSLIATVPQSASVTIITEVLSEADIHSDHYQTAANLQLQWLVNPHPEQGSELASRGIEIWKQLPESNFSHITAEYHTVKKLRDFLRQEMGKGKEDFFACAYWQINKREDEEREKRLD